jgi:excisionase family DNA binding protein
MTRKSVKIESDYITISLAAEILGMTVQAVYDAIKKGWLKEYCVDDGSTVKKVSREEVMAWKEYRESPPWRMRDEKK